jgi:hypothetical protein
MYAWEKIIQLKNRLYFGASDQVILSVVVKIIYLIRIFIIQRVI